VRLVLDTSALFSMNKLPKGELYTTPGVIGEMKKYGDERAGYLAALVNVIEPTKESMKRVREGARITRDSSRLSPVDMEVVALARDLDAAILTDDYSIQNLAKYLGISYSPVNIQGITELVKWRLKCLGCGRVWDEPYPECPVCGSKLRTSRSRK